MAEAVLAIDQGTTGTTAMVLDGRGRILGRAYGEIRQFYPRPGWVEHDPEQIYRSVVRLGRQAVAAARIRPAGLGAIGITNQRETFVVWERKSGRPVHRAIVWQCRRSAAICAALAPREAEVRRRTGLLIDPYFAGTKLKWLLDSDRGLRRRAARGELCFGTIDSWLIFRLSRGAAFVTDFTNASRTMMLNLRERRWDAAMLRMLGVPAAMLPEPRRLARSACRSRRRHVRAACDTDRRGHRRPAIRALRPTRGQPGRGQGDLRHRRLPADAHG